MGILDDLLGSPAVMQALQQAQAKPSAPQSATAPQPAPAASPADPQANDWIKNYIAGQVATARAHPGGLWNLITGRNQDAARINATVAAPAAWDAFKQAQAGSQGAQLGTARDFASTGALTNTNIDPSNPMASIPGMQAAYSGVLNGSPGATSDPSAAPANPIQAQRATYLRMGKFMQMQGNAQMANEFFKLAAQGLPEQTAVRPDGLVGDPINGRAIGVDAGTLAANRAGQKSGAEEGAKLPFTLASQTHQGNVDVGVHSANANTDAAHVPVQVIGRGGPAVISQADMMHAGSSGMVGADGKPAWLPADSPQYKAIQTSQQKEIADARSDAQNASTGLDTATELYNAAHNLYTGKGAEAAQGIRKTLAAVSALTGAPVPDAIAKSTSQFEQLRYAALNFVQSAAHGFSPRAAVQVVKLIQAAKPGDTTSPKGLQAIIEKQVIPAFLRARAMYGATEDYYQKNPLATDAQAQVPNRVPLTKFTVKHAGDQVNPGDYFVSRHDGTIKQRPVE